MFKKGVMGTKCENHWLEFRPRFYFLLGPLQCITQMKMDPNSYKFFWKVSNYTPTRSHTHSSPYPCELEIRNNYLCGREVTCCLEFFSTGSSWSILGIHDCFVNFNQNSWQFISTNAYWSTWPKIMRLCRPRLWDSHWVLPRNSDLPRTLLVHESMAS